MIPAGERADILIGIRIGIITVKLLRPETTAAALIVGNICGNDPVFIEGQGWIFHQF